MDKKGFSKSVRVICLFMIIAASLFLLAGCGGKGATVTDASGQQREQIKWRLQSYAGPALNDHVCKNAMVEFNIAANGEMVVEVYTADQLVPHDELFRALQEGTIVGY